MSIDRGTKVAAALLLAAVVIYYGIVHWRVIWMAEPATARETAFVSNLKGYVQSDGPRPYSLESIPGHTNVYGPGYLWGAAPFFRLLPFAKLVNLRMANAVFLLLLLLAVAIGARSASRLDLLFGLVVIYVLFVGSPSIAAGPDILAVLFYVLAWVVVAEMNLCRAALLASIALGFFALLTKPYLALVVPAIGSYLLLFRSLRVGLVYNIGWLVSFGVGLWVIQSHHPYYFTSVFKIHFAANSPDGLFALKQWGEFSVLALVPFGFAAVLSRLWLRLNEPLIRIRFSWSSPIVVGCAPISLYAWGALVAVAALALSLAWHNGAYLIYFWHLLLPLLVLLLLSQRPIGAGWFCVNLIVLLLCRPPLPPKGTPKDWQELQAVVSNRQNIYLDPFLQYLRPADMGKPYGENAQSEYILVHLSYRRDEALEKRILQFHHHQAHEFKSQSFDGILLTDKIFYNEHLMPVILSKYKLVRAFKVYPYYYVYTSRCMFGRAPVTVYLLDPK